MFLSECVWILLKGSGRVIDGSFSTVNTHTHTHWRQEERGLVVCGDAQLTLFILCPSEGDEAILHPDEPGVSH